METSNPASGFPPTHPRAPIRPRIVPVLDIMGGKVVRAVGGLRSEYRPVRSVLTDSTAPGEVARALVAATGTECLYVADLDAIVQARPDLESVRAVSATKVARVLCDGGFRSEWDAEQCDLWNVQRIIGTETGHLSLVTPAGRWGCGVSIDLLDGRVIGGPASWGGTDDPLEVVARASDAGARTVILLDLSRVGTGTGPGTETLVQAVKRSFHRIELFAGGGVRTWADVQRLTDAGADAVLVASALHDGTLVSGI